MMQSRLLVLALSIGLGVSCSSPRAPVDTGAIQHLLDSTLAVHAQLFINKDVDALLEAYSDSPVVYANHTAPVRGRAALKPFLAAFTQAGAIRSLSYHTEELAVYGDSAWHILTYQVSVQPAGASVPVSDHGGGFALWVRDSSGAWRIQRDIFNSSVPLPIAPR